MIITKDDLKEYIKADSKRFGFDDTPMHRIRQLLVDPMHWQLPNWLLIKELRYSEYYFNNRKKSLFNYIMFIYHIHKLQKLSLKTGIQVPLNVIGKGFAIWHYGSVVLGAAKIGEGFRCGTNTLIGKKTSNGASPIIGNNVYLCTGATIIGEVVIGDNVIIAPNSVVTSNVPSNCLVGGTPAKIIKHYN